MSKVNLKTPFSGYILNTMAHRKEKKYSYLTMYLCLFIKTTPVLYIYTKQLILIDINNN